MSEEHLSALELSVTRLREIASTLSAAELTTKAYPAQWTIAEVLSHLGSGAVITQRRLEDELAGRPTPEDFAPGVWDEWNAKDPSAQREDALAADAALLARLQKVTAAEAADFTSTMGPMTLGFADFVAQRLNEHGLHTWDIEVVRNPAATIPQQVAALVVDNLELIARFTARPTGEEKAITIATTDPSRAFTVELAPEAVTFAPGAGSVAAEVKLPAEAFVRLVYGRLDPEHTPAGDHGQALEVLRRVFPGV